MTNSPETKTGTIAIKRFGQKANLKSMTNELGSKFHHLSFRDSLLIELAEGTAFLFDYGILVLWDIDPKYKTWLENLFLKHIMVSEPESEWESFSFVVNPDSAFSVKNDVFSIPDTGKMALLAVSHALAQSEKLEHFENVAEQLINDNKYLTEELTRSGSIPLSRKALAKLRGKLFQSKSDILLHFNLLDTPEFFWEYPELEREYLTVSKYLDLTNRVELLTLKLETIQQLLDMLASEQNHKHSAFLEWIIIALIAFDILIYFRH